MPPPKKKLKYDVQIGDASISPGFDVQIGEAVPRPMYDVQIGDASFADTVPDGKGGNIRIDDTPVYSDEPMQTAPFGTVQPHGLPGIIQLPDGTLLRVGPL